MKALVVMSYSGLEEVRKECSRHNEQHVEGREHPFGNQKRFGMAGTLCLRRDAEANKGVMLEL